MNICYPTETNLIRSSIKYEFIKMAEIIFMDGNRNNILN